jgi:2,3-dihydroxybiphenyl 1,2-dioxygenase
MIAQLGQLVFEVADLAAWETFATQVLGLELGARLPGGGFTLRLDDRAQRITVVPGPADDLAAIVLETDALDDLVARLRRTGVAVAEADGAPRGVARRVTLVDPSGIPVELTTPGAPGERPCRPTHGAGFVAGDLGLGHIVLSADDRDASRRFYEELLGFRLSDRIVADVHGHKADLLFFHCNPRHHTLALGDRLDKRLHHFMVEVTGIDDVGAAFDRALRHGARVMHTIGRHPNDRMVSFYATTPSGFQFELGHGARVIDDATWEPQVYDHISEWGHHPPQLLRRR